MFKNFLLKQMLKSKLKGVSEDQVNKMVGIVEKNPELFVKIAKEVEEKKKAGMDEMNAMMEVMRSHEAELKGLVG